MVKACCVKNCQSNGRNTNGKVSLHLFPTTNSELMARWIEFLGYGTDWKPPKYAAICSHHFRQTDFSVNTNIRRLLSNAVPSIETELIINKSRKKSTLTANKARKKIEQKKKARDQAAINTQCEKIEDDSACQDVKKTCRLCGFEYTTELKFIFEIDNSYADRINKYLYLSISRDDSLPLSLCTTCQEKFDEIENFIIEVDKVQEILWKKFPSETKIHCENDILEIPNIAAIDTKIASIDSHLPETEKININSNQVVIYPTLLNINEKSMYTNNILLNRTDTENNNIKQLQYNDNTATFSRSDYNSNSFILLSDEKQFKHPIKMETITPMTDLCPTSHIIKPASTNNNKKIEILQDIKLDLNTISLKSFKPIYDESVKPSKNVQPKSNAEKAEVPKNNLHAKKYKYNKVNTLLTTSTLACKECGSKFISKYALTHHIKYICGLNEKCTNKCGNCKKIISNRSEKTKFSCRCGQKLTKTIQKRKAYRPVKFEQVINCK